jgi:hypothetical protein
MTQASASDRIADQTADQQENQRKRRFAGAASFPASTATALATLCIATFFLLAFFHETPSCFYVTKTILP